MELKDLRSGMVVDHGANSWTDEGIDLCESPSEDIFLVKEDDE